MTIYEESRSLDFGTKKKEPTKDFDKVRTLICQMAIPSRSAASETVAARRFSNPA